MIAASIDRTVAMSAPDQIIAGWTTFGIWLLWAGMVATSILISYLVSVPRWGGDPPLPVGKMDGEKV